MDIDIGGITFVQFIKAFKKTYKLTDTTYDYMSYLKVVDCASYCSLIQQYNNPNDVLNFFITPELNSIKLIGGGKGQNMKGGQGLFLLSVVLLFSLTLGSIYQGPAYDEIVSKYGENPTNWPKQPGNAPQYPEDRWYLYILNFGPSQKSIDKYKQELSNWHSDTAQYEEYQKLLSSYKQEFKQLVDVENVKAQTQQIKAESGLTSAQTDLTYSENARDFQKTNEMLMYKTMELLEEKAKQQTTIGMLYGILIGAGGVLGMLTIIIGYMYKNRIQGRIETDSYGVEASYGMESSYNYQRNRQRPVPQIQDSTEQLGLVRRGNAFTSYRGGKTKNYRKKRTTRKRS